MPARPPEDPFVEALELVLLDAEGPAPAPRWPSVLQPTNKAAMGTVKAAIQPLPRFMWNGQSSDCASLDALFFLRQSRGPCDRHDPGRISAIARVAIIEIAARAQSAVSEPGQ
jgi:hypothetical protein